MQLKSPPTRHSRSGGRKGRSSSLKKAALLRPALGAYRLTRESCLPNRVRSTRTRRPCGSLAWETEVPARLPMRLDSRIATPRACEVPRLAKWTHLYGIPGPWTDARRADRKDASCTCSSCRQTTSGRLHTFTTNSSMAAVRLGPPRPLTLSVSSLMARPEVLISAARPDASSAAEGWSWRAWARTW